MNTLVFNSETSNLSIDHLLRQAQSGGLKLQDTDGNIVAFLFSPTDQEALTYIEASLDFNRNLQELREALGRRGGVTTAELLRKSARYAKRRGNDNFSVSPESFRPDHKISRIYRVEIAGEHLRFD